MDMDAEDDQARKDLEDGAAMESPATAKPAEEAKAADKAAAATEKPVEATREKPVAEDKSAKAAPKYARITEEELTTLRTAAAKVTDIEKQVSTVFGTMGNLKQIVAKMQAATPAGAAIEIPADAFSEMEKDFPEVASHVRKALEKSLKGVKGTGGATTADPEEVAKKISAQVREETIKAQEEALADAYPNWREIVGGVDDKGNANPKHPFREWLGRQKPEYRAKINATNSAAIISRAIAKFQTETAAGARPSSKPASEAAKRTARIAAAVQPKGDGGQPKPTRNTADEFEEGFRSG